MKEFLNCTEFSTINPISKSSKVERGERAWTSNTNRIKCEWALPRFYCVTLEKLLNHSDLWLTELCSSDAIMSVNAPCTVLGSIKALTKRQLLLFKEG